MTDRYTELVKQAYEAQQAIQGGPYQAYTSQLARIDADLEAMKAEREGVVAALEAMDDAVEAAKEALDAYFAGRDDNDTEAEESEYDADGLFEEPRAAVYERYGITPPPIEPLASDEDEYATAKAAGAQN